MRADVDNIHFNPILESVSWKYYVSSEIVAGGCVLGDCILSLVLTSNRNESLQENAKWT